MLQNAIHRPNISEWPKPMRGKWTVAEILAMPRSKADAKATLDLLGEPATFYYRGKLCNARKHFAPQYTRGGRCAVCKWLENTAGAVARRRKVKGQHSSTLAVGPKQDLMGRSSVSVKGRGSTLIYPKLAGGQDALEALKAGLKDMLAKRPRDRNGKPIGGWGIDHSIHAGYDLPEGVLIMGREVLKNRRPMTTSKNTIKRNRLPDPNDWSRAADRLLSIIEQAEFVRLGVAVWLHDLIWDADGKLTGVRWDLYVDDPVKGFTTYIGQEPVA